MQHIPMTGTDETLIDLALRTLAIQYVGHTSTLWATWRVHHTPVHKRQLDEFLGPMASWTPSRYELMEETPWFKMCVQSLIPLARTLHNLTTTREAIEGSGLTARQLKPFDDLTPSSITWACEEVSTMLVQNGNKVGADRVGRVLLAETGKYGMTLKGCKQRFDEITKEVVQTGHAVQQWSWLKTLIHYKMNPLLASTNSPSMLWVPIDTGVEIQLDLAETPADHTEETGVAPTESPASSSTKRTADWIVEPMNFKRVPTVFKDPRATQVPTPPANPPATTSKCAGAPPANLM
jgi:hypothetical protein